MCGRLLSLRPASYGYRGRVAGRDTGKLGRLMLIGIPRWRDVGGCPRVRGVGKACNSCEGSSRRGVIGVSSDVCVRRRHRRFQAERRIGVSCRTSRRRRGRCDGTLAGLQLLPRPQYQRGYRQSQTVN